jgi:diguanylate cyclase (GGDEF)-like protein
MDATFESSRETSIAPHRMRGRPRKPVLPEILPEAPVFKPVAPAIPAREFERLNAVRRLGLLDTPPDEAIDRLARLASDHFRAPICLVSLVDEDRVWFKSHLGLGAPQMQRKDSFCGHTIVSEQPLIVRDASQDPRFRGNPLVTAETGVRFYAGHSLHSASGERVGALSLLDYVPHEFSRADIASLATLAAVISGKLQEGEARDAQRRLVDELILARRESPVDTLTQVANRRCLMEALARERIRAFRKHAAIAVFLIDIDQLRVHNELHGEAVGDRILKETARRLAACLRPYDLLGRFAGDTFMAICPEIRADEALRIAERLRSAIARKAYAIDSGELQVSAGIGVAACHFANVKFSALAIADAVECALGDAKKLGHDRIVLEEMKLLS